MLWFKIGAVDTLLYLNLFTWMSSHLLGEYSTALASAQELTIVQQFLTVLPGSHFTPGKTPGHRWRCSLHGVGDA